MVSRGYFGSTRSSSIAVLRVLLVLLVLVILEVLVEFMNQDHCTRSFVIRQTFVHLVKTPFQPPHGEEEKGRRKR